MESRDLTHVDKSGRVQMVDVGAKSESDRLAVAAGEVVMRSETLDLIARGDLAKGDVLNTARLVCQTNSHSMDINTWTPMCFVFGSD